MDIPNGVKWNHIRHENPRVIFVQNTHGIRKKQITWIQKKSHGFTDRKLKIYGRKSPCGVDEVYLPSLRGHWSVFTVPAGLMECIYRPCGAEVYLPSLRG